MTASTYVWPAIPISGSASARPVGSGSARRTNWAWGPFTRLALLTAVSPIYLFTYVQFYLADMPLLGVRSPLGLPLRGPDLRPSQAVDRRRTLYNTVVHCLFDVHYWIHTHHIGLMELLGGLAPPLVQ